jgi:hypothetical protein
MATKICDLTTDELAASLVATELLAGSKSDGATALQAEVARRFASDEAVVVRVDRARRLAVMIEEGMTMAEFRAAGLCLADRRLALALGAPGNFVKFASSGVSVFKKKSQ